MHRKVLGPEMPVCMFSFHLHLRMRHRDRFVQRYCTTVTVLHRICCSAWPKTERHNTRLLFGRDPYHVVYHRLLTSPLYYISRGSSFLPRTTDRLNPSFFSTAPAPSAKLLHRMDDPRPHLLTLPCGIRDKIYRYLHHKTHLTRPCNIPFCQRPSSYHSL